MAKTPPGMEIFQGEIVAAKGPCHVGHQKGDLFQLNCFESGGLCGFFYHDIFPTLSVMQFGGQYPWASKDEVTVVCSDREVALTMIIRRRG